MKTLENLNDQNLEGPPLNAMRAFEAAARLGSVAGASAELQVTSGAVSQQIRLLETVLGAKLVTRAGRGIALTAEGRAVAELIAEPFRGLREASRRLGRYEEPELIRLGAPGSFAAAWLAPRLTRFEGRSDGVSVRLICDPDPSALDRFQLDMAIQFSPTAPAGSNSVRLLSEAYDVLATPDLLASGSGDDWRSLALSAPLIQCGEAEDKGMDWPTWFARRGLRRDNAHMGDRYPLIDQALNAAASGRGLALAPRAIAEPLIEAGRLDVLVGAGVEPTGAGYDLVWPAGRGLRAPGRTLKTYLLEESRPYESAGV
jgi:LysR family glycine cleavage system transcriptional activator